MLVRKRKLNGSPVLRRSTISRKHTKKSVPLLCHLLLLILLACEKELCIPFKFLAENGPLKELPFLVTPRFFASLGPYQAQRNRVRGDRLLLAFVDGLKSTTVTNALVDR